MSPEFTVGQRCPFFKRSPKDTHPGIMCYKGFSVKELMREIWNDKKEGVRCPLADEGFADNHCIITQGPPRGYVVLDFTEYNKKKRALKSENADDS